MGAGFLVPIENKRAAKILPINLGRDGIAFLQSEFKAEKKPLSSMIAPLLNNGGSAFAPLEKGESMKDAKQFKYGRSRPTVAIRKWLADYIVSQWGKNCQLIIEDPWEKPEDLNIRAQKLPHFFSDSGVYYAPDTNAMYKALDTAERASNFLFFGFVISPSVPLPPDGKNVDQDYIALLAQNTKAAFVRAYDWEGYVVWQK